MNTERKLILDRARVAQQALDERRAANLLGGVISCSDMGMRIHIELRKGKTIVFPYRATVEKTEDELIIRSTGGDELGAFNRSEVVGYWKEHIPVDPKD